MTTDLDYLFALMRGMEQKYPSGKDWDESPFRWILAQPSATKGAISRKLVTAWANLYGLYPKQVTVENQIYLDFDGLLVQVKFSTLWSSGNYRFQQIRQGNYDYCLCIGLSPFNMHAWFIPKPALDIYVIGTKGQHTGTGSGETWWLEAFPNDTEPWLDDCGGPLGDVARQFETLKADIDGRD